MNAAEITGNPSPLEGETEYETAPAKPSFPDEYRAWLRDALGVTVQTDARVEYEDFSRAIRANFEQSRFWVALPGRLEELNAAYDVRRGVPLLVAPGSALELRLKPWPSFWEKSYRRNVLFNPRWPEPPGGGWVVPPGWFAQVGDVVRTLITVKYLDGLDEVADALVEVAAQEGMHANKGRLAKAEGYYATHVDVLAPVEVATGLDTETIGARVELQITTELQENIRDLIHRQYESRRLMSTDHSAWQWDYGSEEFSANYLGHVLHYLEGMIMRLREGFRG